MVEEVVQALDDFGCGLRSAVGIFFQEEVAGQPVGVDPGVPVVHPAVGKAHPGEVAFEAGVEDAVIDFVVLSPSPESRYQYWYPASTERPSKR